MSGATLLFFVRKRKIQQLRRETLAQQEFSRKLMESQENERKRIAAELHDSIGQNLIIIKNRAEMAKDQSRDANTQLEEISGIASQAINEVREISYNLRPYQIDRLGLTKAIQSIISKVSQSSTVVISATIEQLDGYLPKESEIHVYRIVQECMNNIIKHSGASEAAIVMTIRDSAIHLTITDNGKGFEPEKLSSSTEDRGFGLKGISERVRILNGSLTINTDGKGTILSINIPLPKRTV